MTAPTLKEQVRKIVAIADLGTVVDIRTRAGAESACYAAIRAALEREPSEAMIDEGWTYVNFRLCESGENIALIALYRAMTAQLLNELIDEWKQDADGG